MEECSLEKTAGSLCSRRAAVICIERVSHQQPWSGLQADVCLDQCAPGDSSGACLFPNTSSNVGTPPPLPILLLLLLAALVSNIYCHPATPVLEAAAAASPTKPSLGQHGRARTQNEQLVT